GKTVCSLTATPLHLPLGLEFSNGRWVASQAIGSESVRRPIVRIRWSLQEDLGSFAISRLRQVEIDGLAMGFKSAEQVHPFAGDPDEGLIDVPGRGFPLYFALQPPVDLRTVGLSPAPDGRVIDRQASLCHEFLEISQVQGES